MSPRRKDWGDMSADLVAMATLSVMTRLASEDGIVTATSEQLAKCADLPVEVIDRGINELSRPTAPHTRQHPNGFCRITRLRDLSGWQLTNYERLK